MEPASASGAPESVSKNAVLFVSAVGSFLTPFMGSSINIALPAIQEQFGLDAVMLSWVPTAYLLAAAVAMVPLGRLADIHGRKKALVWGMTVFTLSSLLCGLSVSAAMLIAARIIQGVGSAMIFAAGLAILTAVFPLGERGRAIGITIASVYIGLSLGPVLGGPFDRCFRLAKCFSGHCSVGIAFGDSDPMENQGRVGRGQRTEIRCNRRGDIRPGPYIHNDGFDRFAGAVTGSCWW